MPYIKVAELAAERESGDLYLLVNFWATKTRYDNFPTRPDLTEDFVMHLAVTEQRHATDANGWWQRSSDGVFVDPRTVPPDDTTEWVWETVQVPRALVVASIKDNIRRFYQQAVANRWRGDRTLDSSKPFYVDNVQVDKGTSQRLARIANDRFGLLLDPTIIALRGTQDLP